MLTLAPCVHEPAPVRTPPAHADARDVAPPEPPAADGALPAADVAVDAARDAALATEPGGVTPPAALGPTIERVRREDWAHARAALEALPTDVQRGREGRYLGGRIALALGDDGHAVELLHGLGSEIPALGTGIARLEAQALAHGGHHAEARAAYEQLARTTGAERDRALAADEALAAGDAAAASSVMRAWPADPPAGIERARAWQHAAEALEATHDSQGAVRAYKRLLVDEPDAHAAGAAQVALARLGVALSADERLARAANLNERARYVDAINELSAMPAARGATEARRLHLLGRALYWSRARYADASATLRMASQRADNPDRDEDAFLSARSLARSDHDDDAVAEYDHVARTRQGRWGDEAAFRAAWLEAHHDHGTGAIARLRAFLHDRPDATEHLRTEAAWELGWVLLAANRFAEASAALDQSTSIATHALERGRGRYWSAVAKLRGGDAAGAVHDWQALDADRPMTWYALLSETRLRARGVAVAPPADPPPRRAAPPVALPDDVRWLRALGFDREGGALLAAQEDALRAQLPHDRADEALAVAYLELGEPRRAYAIAQRHNDVLDHEPTAETRWIWDCAYPRPWAHWIEAAEDENHLPRDYLFAIMRQESAYNPRDVSNARAIGLLQMIPPTTRRVAQTLGIEFREELLFEPDYNIRTGGWYIGRLFQQYGGVLPRSIGAFNAGPGAMGRWVRQWPTLELDAFVERIPYDETRTYVRRVIQNLERYRYLYGAHDADWPMRLPLAAEPHVENVVDY